MDDTNAVLSVIVYGNFQTACRWNVSTSTPFFSFSLRPDFGLGERVVVVTDMNHRHFQLLRALDLIRERLGGEVLVEIQEPD